MSSDADRRLLDGALHLRLGVYTDYSYHEVDGKIYAERAFAKFLGRLGVRFRDMAVLGRLDPAPERARYELPDGVRFVPLPHYQTLTDAPAVLAAIAGTFRSFWRVLDELDVVWLLGPHPFAFAFFAMARLRRRVVVLGIRQDSIEYMRNRHPDRPLRLGFARLMEAGFRLLARSSGAVAVGPDIAARYASRASVLEITVSLVEESDIADAVEATKKDYSGELTALSVGRLEQEKNPLLMADVLSRLNCEDERWRLVVCGEGAMQGELEHRFAEFALRDQTEMRGYVPIDRGLVDLYRSAHAFLHVSWTEGLPQTLVEALANGLPCVATDVGGIRVALGEGLLLVPPGDPDAAADALERIAADQELRRQLVEKGLELASSMTIDRETARVAKFIRWRTQTD